MAQPPIIYDASTPIFRPLWDRGLRSALVFGIEWASLSLIEDSPSWLKLATMILASLGLAIIESRYFLMLKKRGVFAGLLAVVICIWVALVSYAAYHYNGEDKLDQLSTKIVSELHRNYPVPSPSQLAVHSPDKTKDNAIRPSTQQSDEVASLVSQRDEAIRERDELKNEVASRVPGELPLELAEQAAIKIAYRGKYPRFWDQIANSKNIKSVRVEYTNAYISRTINCSDYCVKLIIVLDNNYGPFSASIGQIDDATLGIERKVPPLVITQNGESHVELVLGTVETFGLCADDGLHEFRISLEKSP